MGTTLREKMARLTSERRARIEAEADRLHAEYQTLKDLRKARDLTQAQLAESLGIRQATIAQLEKRSDLMISTLRSYVGAWAGASGGDQTVGSLVDRLDRGGPRVNCQERTREELLETLQITLAEGLELDRREAREELERHNTQLWI